MGKKFDWWLEKRVTKGDSEVQDENSPLSRPASMSGGVLPMDVEGPFGDERYRLTYGMSEADRNLRHQWLKDQMLAECEPVVVPGYYQARFNPIRRFLNFPGHSVAWKLEKKFDPTKVWHARYLCKGAFYSIAAFYFLSYYFTYSTARWDTGRTAWRIYESKPRLLPGEPGYSDPDPTVKSDFCDMGFKKADPLITGYRGN